MLASIALIVTSSAATLPSLETRTLISRAQTIVTAHGDRLWRGYSRTALRVQLVEADREVLFCSAPVQGFVPLATDPVTGCNLQARARELPTDITAAVELDNQLVIQVGTPAALEMTDAEWVVTLLHEAFHQYQADIPAYWTAVDDVRGSLAQTDVMWPLNYDFPYADPRVGNAFADLRRHAFAFLAARTLQAARRAIVGYVSARSVARERAGAEHWRYYEFQIGQEGIAWWTELKLGAVAGRREKAIESIAHDRWRGLSTSLRAIDAQGLAVWKRSSFYVLGAIEAEMLERSKPGWREEYRRAPFSIGDQLASVVDPTR